MYQITDLHAHVEDVELEKVCECLESPGGLSWTQ